MTSAMTTPILKRFPLFGSEESKSASMSRTKMKSVTMIMPEGEFGSRGNTQFKKTPSRVSHTGINSKKLGKQSSIDIQRKCVWYNAQHEAEKRGINLEHPPEEWQKLFDTIKMQLETSNDRDRLIDDDGKLIWNIPSLPGDCTVEKGNVSKQNVAEKINFNKIATEKSMLPKQSLVRSHWINGKWSGVSRGVMAVLSIRQSKEKKPKPTPAIAAGPPPILTSSPEPFRVKTIKKQHKVIRNITPCFPRTKNSHKTHSCTAPRPSYQDKCYSNGVKRERIKRRNSMSARAQRIMSITKGEEPVCKKPDASSPFLQLTRDLGYILKNTPNHSPSHTTAKWDVSFRNDSYVSRTRYLKSPIICGALKSKSPSLTPRLEPQPTMSPVPTNWGAHEPKSLTSPVITSPPSKVSKEAKIRQTPTGDGGGDRGKIQTFSLLKCMEPEAQSSEKLRIVQPLNSPEKENKLTDTLKTSKIVTASLQRNVISGLSTLLPKASSVCPISEKSEKRKKPNQQEESKSKRRRLDNEAVNLPSRDLNSTESSEIATPKRRTDNKSRVPKNTLVSPISIPATPNISRPAKKKLSPGLISVSPSHKRKKTNYIGSASLKRKRSLTLSADKKKEPSSILKDDTLGTPLRFVLQDKKEEPPILETAVGGGTRLIQYARSEERPKKTTGGKTSPQNKKQIQSENPSAELKDFVGVDTINELVKPERAAAPSLVRLKEQFNILEQDLNLMAAHHKIRFSAVFNKIRKLETMVEMLCQHTKSCYMLQNFPVKTDAPVKK